MLNTAAGEYVVVEGQQQSDLLNAIAERMQAYGCSEQHMLPLFEQHATEDGPTPCVA